MKALYRQTGLRSWWLGAVLVIAASALLSFVFARHQSIWGDEATHLAGLTLSFSGLLDWLGGHDPFRFGVPPDRMPPLGYMLGQAWAGLFGAGEFAMRMFGLAVSITGLAFLAATLRRVSQTFAALMVLALYALSLNYVQYSVEIRPYALVLMMASAMVYAACRYFSAASEREENRWLLALAAGGAVSVYIHYTTLIFSLSLLGSLGLFALYERRGFWKAFTAAVVVVIAVVPLVPLILAGMSVKTAVLQTELKDIPRYFARLFASRPEAVVAPVMGIVIIAKLAALATTVAARPQRFQVAMLIAIAAGIFGMMVSSLIVPGSMMQPHYSIWVLPALFTLFLLPSGSIAPRIAAANSAALCTATLCLAGSMALLLPNMQVFAHGPARQIAEAIAKAPAGSAIVYDYGEDAWWNTFYPVRLAHGTSRQQVLVLRQEGRFAYFDPDGYMANLNGVAMPELAGNPLQDVRSIVLIRARSFDLADMRRYLFSGSPNLEANDVETQLAKINGYRVSSEQFVPGTTSARVLVMER